MLAKQCCPPLLMKLEEVRNYYKFVNLIGHNVGLVFSCLIKLNKYFSNNELEEVKKSTTCVLVSGGFGRAWERQGMQICISCR